MKRKIKDIQHSIDKLDPDFTYKLMSMGLAGALMMSKHLWSVVAGVLVFIYILYVESKEK